MFTLFFLIFVTLLVRSESDIDVNVGGSSASGSVNVEGVSGHGTVSTDEVSYGGGVGDFQVKITYEVPKISWRGFNSRDDCYNTFKEATGQCDAESAPRFEGRQLYEAYDDSYSTVKWTSSSGVYSMNTNTGTASLATESHHCYKRSEFRTCFSSEFVMEVGDDESKKTLKFDTENCGYRGYNIRKKRTLCAPYDVSDAGDKCGNCFCVKCTPKECWEYNHEVVDEHNNPKYYWRGPDKIEKMPCVEGLEYMYHDHIHYTGKDRCYKCATCFATSRVTVKKTVAKEMGYRLTGSNQRVVPTISKDDVTLIPTRRGCQDLGFAVVESDDNSHNGHKYQNCFKCTCPSSQKCPDGYTDRYFDHPGFTPDHECEPGYLPKLRDTSPPGGKNRYKCGRKCYKQICEADPSRSKPGGGCPIHLGYTNKQVTSRSSECDFLIGEDGNYITSTYGYWLSPPKKDEKTFMDAMKKPCKYCRPCPAGFKAMNPRNSKDWQCSHSLLYYYTDDGLQTRCAKCKVPCRQNAPNDEKVVVAEGLTCKFDEMKILSGMNGAWEQCGYCRKMNYPSNKHLVTIPLYTIKLEDEQGGELYVSAKEGELRVGDENDFHSYESKWIIFQPDNKQVSTTDGISIMELSGVYQYDLYGSASRIDRSKLTKLRRQCVTAKTGRMDRVESGNKGASISDLKWVLVPVQGKEDTFKLKNNGRYLTLNEKSNGLTVTGLKTEKEEEYLQIFKIEKSGEYKASGRDMFGVNSCVNKDVEDLKFGIQWRCNLYSPQLYKTKMYPGCIDQGFTEVNPYGTPSTYLGVNCYICEWDACPDGQITECPRGKKPIKTGEFNGFRPCLDCSKDLECPEGTEKIVAYPRLASQKGYVYHSLSPPAYSGDDECGKKAPKDCPEGQHTGFCPQDFKMKYSGKYSDGKACHVCVPKPCPSTMALNCDDDIPVSMNKPLVSSSFRGYYSLKQIFTNAWTPSPNYDNPWWIVDSTNQQYFSSIKFCDIQSLKEFRLTVKVPGESGKYHHGTGAKVVEQIVLKNPSKEKCIEYKFNGGKGLLAKRVDLRNFVLHENEKFVKLRLEYFRRKSGWKNGPKTDHYSGHDRCTQCLALTCPNPEAKPGWKAFSVDMQTTQVFHETGYFSGNKRCTVALGKKCPIGRVYCGTPNGWNSMDNGEKQLGKPCYTCIKKDCPEGTDVKSKCKGRGWNFNGDYSNYHGSEICGTCTKKACPEISSRPGEKSRTDCGIGYQIRAVHKERLSGSRIGLTQYSGDDVCNVCDPKKCPSGYSKYQSEDCSYSYRSRFIAYSAKKEGGISDMSFSLVLESKRVRKYGQWRWVDEKKKLGDYNSFWGYTGVKLNKDEVEAIIFEDQERVYQALRFCNLNGDDEGKFAKIMRLAYFDETMKKWVRIGTFKADYKLRRKRSGCMDFPFHCSVRAKKFAMYQIKPHSGMDFIGLRMRLVTQDMFELKKSTFDGKHYSGETKCLKCLRGSKRYDDMCPSKLPGSSETGWTIDPDEPKCAAGYTEVEVPDWTTSNMKQYDMTEPMLEFYALENGLYCRKQWKFTSRCANGWKKVSYSRWDTKVNLRVAWEKQMEENGKACYMGQWIRENRYMSRGNYVYVSNDRWLCCRPRSKIGKLSVETQTKCGVDEDLVEGPLTYMTFAREYYPLSDGKNWCATNYSIDFDGCLHGYQKKWLGKDSVTKAGLDYVVSETSDYSRTCYRSYWYTTFCCRDRKPVKWYDDDVGEKYYEETACNPKFEQRVYPKLSYSMIENYQLPNGEYCFRDMLRTTKKSECLSDETEGDVDAGRINTYTKCYVRNNKWNEKGDLKMCCKKYRKTSSLGSIKKRDREFCGAGYEWFSDDPPDYSLYEKYRLPSDTGQGYCAKWINWYSGYSGKCVEGYEKKQYSSWKYDPYSSKKDRGKYIGYRIGKNRWCKKSVPWSCAIEGFSWRKSFPGNHKINLEMYAKENGNYCTKPVSSYNRMAYKCKSGYTKATYRFNHENPNSGTKRGLVQWYKISARRTFCWKLKLGVVLECPSGYTWGNNEPTDKRVEMFPHELNGWCFKSIPTYSRWWKTCLSGYTKKTYGRFAYIKSPFREYGGSSKKAYRIATSTWCWKAK